VIIHDASVFAYPEAFSFNFLMKYRTLFQHFGKLSNPIITVSEFSKREISRYCNIDLESIVVIPPGHEHFLAIQPDPSIIHRLNIQYKPFILSVGSNSPHKNTQILHSALETITRIGYDLVIVGGSFDHVFRSVEESWPPTVHVAGYISDGELRTLYEHASALIFPSFYEGFGLPVLEAMALGCPVICSNTASMPEVGGDAVLYFDPNQPEELCRQLVELMNNSALRDGLQPKGILQAAKFSWQYTAKSIWDILSKSMVK
jgi:glycosyltransferase involved in cell wall biosynthesis